MSASRHKDRHETEQEETEMEELERHKARICEGPPLCGYCLDDFEEAEYLELEKMGYYDWNGKWTT